MSEKLNEYNRKHKDHLINLIGTRSEDRPNFALLIGAGASACSGVKTATQMVDEWRHRLYAQSGDAKPFQEWLEAQNWHGDDEYSILFEKVCDQPSQRRVYVENCVKDAKPSWGYIYLASLIASTYFNVVFTPNFDDLLNEACFAYADQRPIVCAHDSAVADIRVTSARPKILKLHGDFLYDSIKNTLRETESLERNTKDKFMQFAREYGLIVVGYGGNDRSIMDVLEAASKSDGLLHNGLYWCVRSGDRVSKKLSRLMRREKAYWVEIEGFDEFMAEVHHRLGLTLPKAVREPYQATTERINRFVSPDIKETQHPAIKKDVAALTDHIKWFKDVVSGKASQVEIDRLVPYQFLGDTEFDKNPEQALAYYQKALVIEPNDPDVMARTIFAHIASNQCGKAIEVFKNMLAREQGGPIVYFYGGIALACAGSNEEAVRVLEDGLQRVPEGSAARASFHTTIGNCLLLLGKWNEALSEAEKSLKIKPKGVSATLVRCLAMKKLGRQEEASAIVERLVAKDKDIDAATAYELAAGYAFLGEKAKMLESLKLAIDEKAISRVFAMIDPDFADYRQEPDFRKLVYGET
jgi:tetratricopeptide (TPR) repeat protein/NAD-dependent SIR2 family protein deacetylase